MKLTKHRKWLLYGALTGFVVYLIGFAFEPEALRFLYLPMYATFVSWVASCRANELLFFCNEGVGESYRFILILSQVLSYALVGYGASKLHSLYLKKRGK